MVDHPSNSENYTARLLFGPRNSSVESKIVIKYCAENPSAQTALDIFKGCWKSALAPELGLVTGSKEGFHNDSRVHWVASLFPRQFQGMEVLELGPFEGYDSYLLEQLGAAKVISIEGNNINFLKCLVLKDALGLKTSFLHGGFLQYLKNTDRRFDLVWASGVLYHSEDPIELLEQIGRKTNRLYLWTHYYSDENVNRFLKEKNVEQSWGGDTYLLHYRSYGLDQFKNGVPLHYEGGQQSFSFWMARADIDRVLQRIGFGSIKLHSEGKLSNGFTFVSLFAERV